MSHTGPLIEQTQVSTRNYVKWTRPKEKEKGRRSPSKQRLKVCLCIVLCIWVCFFVRCTKNGRHIPNPCMETGKYQWFGIGAPIQKHLLQSIISAWFILTWSYKLIVFQNKNQLPEKQLTTIKFNKIYTKKNQKWHQFLHGIPRPGCSRDNSLSRRLRQSLLLHLCRLFLYNKIRIQ